MSWYWVVAISLVWIAALYVYAYRGEKIAQREQGRALVNDEIFFSWSYVALYVSWPALVLWQGFIDASWYVHILLAVEVMCLSVLPQLCAQRMLKTSFSFSSIGGNFPEKVVSLLAVVTVMAVAPLGIALWFASNEH